MKGKLKSKAKAKLATRICCTVSSFGLFIGSTCGIAAFALKSQDYKDQAANQYRIEKIAKLDEDYASGDINDSKYVAEYTTISLCSNEDYLKMDMSDGSEQVQALLKQSNIGYWAFAPGVGVIISATGLILSANAVAKASIEVEDSERGY